MSGKYQKQLTIMEVIEKLNCKQWVLPNIQRRFVWDAERIVNLFDSILQGYPIGSFMVWKTTSEKTIREMQFFSFIQNYQERWHETCDEENTIKDEVYSVIDGQQRLNSIYIGLLGSYAEKLPHKKWKASYNPDIQPQRHLYLNICEPDTNDDNGRRFDLKFLSKNEFYNLPNNNYYFRLNDIRKIKNGSSDTIKQIINEMGIDKLHKQSAIKNLKIVYNTFCVSKIINYYLEEDNELDKVVDIFVRANSGGVPLSFSEMVMSKIVSEWSEARSYFDGLVSLIRNETRIEITHEFILKCFLYLFSEDIRFKITNIDNTLIDNIKKHMDDVRCVIESTCMFALSIGLNDEVIRSKYSLLPVLYYSYITGKKLNNVNNYELDKNKSGLFLKLSLIKGLFGGSPDSILLPIRKIINNSIANNNQCFPLKQISNYFIGRPRDLQLSDDDIKAKINDTHWGTADARLLLSLITNINPNFTDFHIDHLYPKRMFTSKNLKTYDFIKNNKELLSFYMDKNNWNTLGNLQLLNQQENQSKNGRSLLEWFKDNQEYASTCFIPRDDNGNYICEERDFKIFVEKRRIILFNKLKEKTKI